MALEKIAPASGAAQDKTNPVTPIRPPALKITPSISVAQVRLLELLEDWKAAKAETKKHQSKLRAAVDREAACHALYREYLERILEAGK